MAVVKRSRQREAIKEFLMSRKDHPTAEVVYEFVSKDFPNISLGTVYRNLSFLVDNGMAIKVPCEDGSVHFDGNVEPHYHFQCMECGSVLDLDFDSKEVEKAFNIAMESNLDLVKIAPQAKPPVCKVMDYGKYRFEQAKREKEK